MTTQTQQQAGPTAATGTAVRQQDIVEQVEKRIEGFVRNGGLHLPANYSAPNALRSAWLILQQTVDKNQKPVMEVCTKPSIANALLDMVVQGLNPSKDQCYFIAYGNRLLCQRSYFGSMALAKQMANAKDIWGAVVYEGDVFTYEIKGNRKIITKHEQKIENVQPDKIRAAYCVIEFDNGILPYTEIMTIDQIHKAWHKGRWDTAKANDPHNEFPDQMALKTVINRACKSWINSSSDDHLFLEAVNRADEERAEMELEEEVAENANKEEVDVTPQCEVSDETQGTGGKDVEPPQPKYPF